MKKQLQIGMFLPVLASSSAHKNTSFQQVDSLKTILPVLPDGALNGWREACRTIQTDITKKYAFRIDVLFNNTCHSFFSTELGLSISDDIIKTYSSQLKGNKNTSTACIAGLPV